MLLLVLFFPFISAFVNGFFGRWLGKTGAIFIAIPSMVLACVLSWYGFFSVGLSHKVYTIQLFAWIKSGFFEVYWGFMFDSLTVSMLVVVTTISLLVHLYSIDYMGEDPHFVRFLSYLSFFTFSMLILVTSDNFLQLFLGWEAVGLSSYLLINFWFTRVQANKSAIKAMLMNRFGDFFLGLGICLIFYVFKTVDYAAVFALVPVVAGTDMNFIFLSVDKITLVSFLLFMGAVGKSAQLGLHTWLPDAMEGPTPVSALIHAATMVTAGVFLLVRCSPLLEYSFGLLNFVMVLAALTAVFASTVGMFQNDVKRVIAFSTTSQLGYMILACSLSAYSVGMFHLVNHAFFKALLFLGSGAIIHAMGDEQDIRKMGGLVKLLPFVHVCMLIGSLALAGVPFLAGFYSKDAILELAYAHYEMLFGYWFGTLATFFTAFYSVRLLYFTFYSSPNGYRQVVLNAAEASWIMQIPLVVLILGSLFAGYLFRDMFIGFGTDFWGAAIMVLPQHLYILESEFLPVSVKLVPTIFSFSGAMFSYLLYSFFANSFRYFLSLAFFRKLYLFFSKRWMFDIFYNEVVAQASLRFGYFTSFRLLDRGVVELIGPYGLAKLSSYISSSFNFISTGYLYHYILIAFFGGFFFFSLFFFSFVSVSILFFLVVGFFFFCFV
jgi:NADH-ubiquinone oxidoreductase chain 5